MTAAAPAPAFIVDKIFPANQVHLIFGPARSGKTTYMLQLMDDWSHGRPVLGRESYSAPYCWVSCERNTDSIRTHMKRIGLNPEEVPHFALLDLETRDNQTIDAAIAIARRQIPKLAVMFIDGLHALCPGKIFDTKDVTAFMIHVQQLMREFRLTIIGTVASPKSKPEDSGTPPGERFIGSTAWASTTDCKILVEPLESGNPGNPARKMFVMPSNLTATVSTWEFNDRGLLEFKADQANSPLDMWLESMVDDETIIETKMVVQTAEDVGMSKSSADRWIRKQLEAGKIYKVEQGKYRKSKLQ